MKFSMKRIAALVLALVMVVGILPVVNNSVNAADLAGLTDTSIGLTVGTASNWSASENKISGSVTGVNRVGKVYLAASDTLTITNNKTTAATLSFDFTISGNFDVSGSKITIDETDYTAATTSSYSQELKAGGSITITLNAARNRNGDNTLSIDITNLNLVGISAGPITTTFEAPAYGSYTVAYGTTEKTVAAGTASVSVENEASVQYTLTANPGTGYKFIGWYNVSTDSYLSTAQTYAGYFDTACTVKAVIVPETAAVFMVGGNYYADLNAAVAYATANSLTQITLVQSGTLAANDEGYTIPVGITLLIPMDDLYTVTPTNDMGIAPESTTDVVTPEAYLTLTLAEGASLTVNGTVDVEAKHTALQGGKPAFGGRVSGAYGAIYMSPESNITLNSGAILYAWGYVFGEGTVTANSGAKVYEIMQVTDFPGGNNLAAFVDKDLLYDENGDGVPDNDYLKTFPFSQYYVQNIEVALTLNAGATEYIYTTIYAASMYVGTDVEFIGGSGMFIPESGSITKDYDPSTDRLIVDVNGDATVSSIVLDMSDTKYAAVMKQFIGSDKFDSSRYILSLNSNITINVNSGTTTIGQDMSLLPGVKIYVGKNATLEIAQQVLAEGENSYLTVYGSAGHNVYAWDLENWGKYAYLNKYLVAASYSPTTGRYMRTAADLEDALVDINGTVICNGFIYSTVTFDDDWNPVSGGAAIISSGKTGKIILQAGAGEEDFAYCLDGSSTVNYNVTVDSVWLKNGDGSFLTTDGAAAGTTYNYCARHDRWYTGSCADCATPDAVEITWIVDGTGGPQEVEYNTTPVYAGGTPTKAQSGCTTYTFAGWSTSADGEVLATLPVATEDAVYYAIFTEGASHSWNAADCITAKTCSACGETEGGVDLNNHAYSDSTYYGDINDDTHTVYYYCCNNAKVTEAHTYVAGICDCNAKQKITVNVYWNGELVWTLIEDYGTTTTIPTSGAPTGYHFVGYAKTEGGEIFLAKPESGNPEYTYTESIDLYSVFAKNTYTITWTVIENIDDEQVGSTFTTAFKYGETITAPAYTAPSGYKVVSIEGVGETMPANDLELQITITPESYDLYVYDLDGSVLLSTQVPYGANVTEYLKDLTATAVRVETVDQIGWNVFAGWVDADMNPIDESYTMPANSLIVSADMTFSGWIKYGYIDGWVYEIENSIQYTGWTQIDGSWYYLDPETGIRAEGVARVPYPTVAINGITYAPNAEDVAYAESKGETFIDKDTGLFYFDENGKFQYDYTDAVIDGDAARWAINGLIQWHPGMVMQQGSVFYFIGDETNGGNILATGDVYVVRNTTELKVTIGGVYTFGGDGALLTYNGIAKMADGTLRCYENAQLMLGEGLVNVDGEYYYVTSDGSVAAGTKYWVAKTNGYDVAVGEYEFDENGVMIIPEADPVKNGFYYEDGAWYYYVDGVKGYCAGLINSDGIKWYETADAEGVENDGWVYVKSTGALATGEYYVTNVGNHATVKSGDLCVFNSDGLMQDAKNGIVAENGGLYYYQNNKLAKAAGLIKLEDGSYIYVRTNGQLVVNTKYWTTNVNETGIVPDVYAFDANGKMVLPVEDNFTGIKDGCYYVDGEIAYGLGLMEIEEGKYIYVRSTGELATGMYWITNHNDVLTEGYYDFGENGVLVIE